MKKIDSILNDALKEFKLGKEEFSEIEKIVKDFLEKVNGNLKNSGLNAEIFVGGSFAKKTMIKKAKYDVDIFVRFDKKYKGENISNLCLKLLKGFKDFRVIHGSRDYFALEMREDLVVELIPVMKVSKPEDSDNITDLSYMHVKYINKKIKSQKIIDDILLAKAFCHAHHCYGAESYVQGFSGYAIELLILAYGSFEKMVKAMAKKSEDKIVIDIKKHFKNKREILMDINESKLHSPIILVDPTFKYRNAVAALSLETFQRFKEACKEFLKNPSVEMFHERKTDIEKIKSEAEKNKFEFVLLEAKTDKPEGDVAGSKLVKFYRHLEREITRYFEIMDKGFNYNEKQAARFYFVAKARKEILIEGPLVSDKENLEAFEKAHKNYSIKKDRVYAKEFVDFSLEEFVKKWKKKYIDKMKGMSVVGLEVV